MTAPKILVGWTTVDSAKAAHKLAAALVAARLVACAQVDGPVTSHYFWEGKQERTQEWRLWVKFPARHAKKIAAFFEVRHPYSTPQWVAVEASIVAQAYRQWAEAGTRPLSGRRRDRRA